jgi:hypothetical protein
MPRKVVSSPSPPQGTCLWVNRITELRYCLPSEMIDHPLQHKIHLDFQRSVMRGLLEEVGIADALRAYVSPSTGALVTLDGHLRRSLGETPWPTLILDVTDEEAAYILLTGDEVTGLAQKEEAALARLLETVRSADSAVQQMLEGLVRQEPLPRLTMGDPDPAPGYASGLSSPSPLYEPSLTPAFTATHVTASDLAHAGVTLQETIHQQRSLRAVMCPHCATEFYIEQTSA